MPKGPEARLSDAVRRLLAAHGIPCYSTETKGVRRSTGVSRGISDLILLPEGDSPWFIELKSPKGRLTEHQKTFAADVKAAGGKFMVWRTIDDCQRWIDGDEDDG